MKEEIELGSVFEKFDAVVEEQSQAFHFVIPQKPILRVRTPWAKFLEWCMRGGGMMSLLFLLVSLSGIRWSGVSYGFLIVPLTLVLCRPLLGPDPIRAPRRLLWVTLGGMLFTIFGAVILDWARFGFDIGSPDIFSLAFYFYYSLRAFVLPEYMHALLPLLAILMLTTIGVARDYPWLERGDGLKFWQVKLSRFCALVAAVLIAVVLSFSDSEASLDWVEETVSSSRTRAYTQGRQIPQSGTGLDIQALGLLGDSPDEWLEQVDSLDTASLADFSTTLTTQLEERRNSITVLDLELALAVLLRANEEGLTQLAFADLCWRLTNLSQEFGLTGQLRQTYLNDEVGRKLFARVLSQHSFVPNELSVWRQRLTRLDGEELSALQDAVWADELLVNDLCGVGATFENRIPWLISFASYQARVEQRFLLTRYSETRYKDGVNRIRPNWGRSLPSTMFRKLGTEQKVSFLSARLKERTRSSNLEGKTPALAIVEARQLKMETGEYPASLSGGADFEYQFQNGVAALRDKQSGEVLWRLP